MAAPHLQLDHPGLEPRHPTDDGAPLGQLLGGLLRQLHKSLTNNYALQDNASKNKSASQMEEGRRLTSTHSWVNLAHSTMWLPSDSLPSASSFAGGGLTPLVGLSSGLLRLDGRDLHGPNKLEGRDLQGPDPNVRRPFIAGRILHLHITRRGGDPVAGLLLLLLLLLKAGAALRRTRQR